MQVKEPIPEFLEDYKKLIRENQEFKREKDKLEVKIEILEKGLMFLAQQIDQVQGTDKAEYLLKQILQK